MLKLYNKYLLKRRFGDRAGGLDKKNANDNHSFVMKKILTTEPEPIPHEKTSAILEFADKCGGRRDERFILTNPREGDLPATEVRACWEKWANIRKR